MLKGELLEILEKLAESYDAEESHLEADEALLKFIDDPEITEAYNKISRYYS